MRSSQQQEDDCRWLLTTPAITTLGSPLPFSWGQEARGRTCIEPSATAHTGDSHSLPLGLYAEQLVARHLAWRQDIAHVINNLVVSENRITRGEFDLLIQPSGQSHYFHLEFAVKFYLGQPDSGLWLGINPTDRLDKKQRHMFKKQLCLGDSRAGKACLQQHGIQISASGARIQGILFYPLGREMPSPEGVCSDHQRGFWCHAHAMAKQSADWRFQRLPSRLQWLSGELTDKGEEALLTPQELALLAQGKPQMVLRHTQPDTGLHQTQSERWVIVPDHWLDTVNCKLGLR